MTTVAIDWDGDSARVAVAEKSPSGPKLVRVAVVDDCGEVQRLASRLREALPEVRWSRAKLIASIGGERVAFRLLKLPPTPDRELPEMVRLVADKEFGAADEGVVDFVSVAGDATSPRKVLAARASRATIQAYVDLADELDAGLVNLCLRACGASSLAKRLDPSLTAADCLLLAPAGGSTDLTVLVDGTPAMIRAGRGDIPSDGSEARRTRSAAAVQLGKPVDRTVGFATAGGKGSLSLGSLSASLPAAEAKEAISLVGAIGVAFDSVEQRRPEFDLLNPRQATRDASPRQRQRLLAGLAAASVLLGAYWGYDTLASYDRELQQLQAEVARVEQRTEKLQPLAKRAAEVELWLATDVNWLDEFEQLGRELRPETLDAEDYPADRDVMLTMLTGSASGGRLGRGGQISFEAVAKDPDAAEQVQRRMRDDRHIVEQGSLDKSGERPYVWRFKPTVRVIDVTPKKKPGVSAATTDREPTTEAVP